jgi:hypothetical protein
VYREGDPLYSGTGPAGGYEPEHTGPYPADSLPGGYSDDSLPGPVPAYHDDPLPGRYDREPASPYPGDRPGRYEPERTAAYPAGRYEDEPTGVYRGDLLNEGYDDEPGGRYSTGDHSADPLAGDYPTGPSVSDYPGADGPRDYPVSPREPGYSSARPYVKSRSRSRDADLPEEGRAHEPRRSRGRRDDDELPESFPYGPTPSERSAGGRTR